MALGLGVGMLGKGMFYVFCNWLYEHLVVRGWRRGLRDACWCALGFFGPVAAYLGLVKMAGVSSSGAEISQYRQFVWMLDYAREGRFAEVPWRWTTGLAVHLQAIAAIWPIPLALCGLLLLRTNRRDFALPGNVTRHLVAYAVSAAAFWVLGSVLFARLCFTYYPVIVILLGTLASRKLEQPAVCLQFGLVLQALAFALGILPC